MQKYQFALLTLSKLQKKFTPYFWTIFADFLNQNISANMHISDK